MLFRLMTVFTGIMLVLALFTGCGGGSSGTSHSSSWLGLTTTPETFDPAEIEIKPSAVTLSPGQTISLALLVKDSFGHPLDDVEVQLASELGGTFEDEKGETYNGWFSTRFTAGKSAGTEAITVFSKGLMETKSLLVQTGVPDTTDIKIVSSSDSTLAETPVTLAVGVAINGNQADGENVLLSSTIPGRFYDDSGSVENGWFTTSFTPDSSAYGVGTITAMVNGEKADKSLAVVKQKQSSPQLQISVHPDAVFQDQTAAVIVIAKDSEGFPSDSKVYLSTSLNGEFYDKEGTPQDGVFFTEFTAGKEVGSASLNVHSMEASASTILSIERPTIVADLSPSVDSVKVGEMAPVSLLVTDTYSRPIPYAQVYLSASLGCYCEPESGETNDDGYYFFDFVASQTAGISTIRALTAGASDSADITVVGP
ncbi:MAG: hypothetical protein ACQETH_09330 [Candidatus Rifleibacteriota bacterium]